jgi:hypothetical protein
MSDVLAYIKEGNPCYVTVTGRPLTPTDQGELEAAHGPVKRIIAHCVHDRQSK